MAQRFVALAEQLNQIRQEIEQSSTLPGSDPELQRKVSEVLAQMRAVTKEAMAQMEAMAMAGEMRQKADELQTVKQAGGAAKGPPQPEGPWEADAIVPLVASLLQLAQPPARHT